MKFYYTLQVAVSIINILIPIIAASSFRFTNFICTSHDESFIQVSYCYIKSVNRTYQFISAKIHVLKPPLEDIDLNAVFLKKANGLRPFLYNISVDGCKFMGHKTKNSLVNYFFETIKYHSNINHSCPYNHDIIIEKADVRHVMKLSTMLPVPSGTYCMDSFWRVHKQLKLSVRVCGVLNTY